MSSLRIISQTEIQITSLLIPAKNTTTTNVFLDLAITLDKHGVLDRADDAIVSATLQYVLP